MSEQTAAVIREVVRERLNQDAIWGGPEHDDGHTVTFWCMLMNKTLTHVHPRQIAETRELFIVIAALAVAGAESLDRRFP